MQYVVEMSEETFQICMKNYWNVRLLKTHPCTMEVATFRMQISLMDFRLLSFGFSVFLLRFRKRMLIETNARNLNMLVLIGVVINTSRIYFEYKRSINRCIHQFLHNQSYIKKALSEISDLSIDMHSKHCNFIVLRNTNNESHK